MVSTPETILPSLNPCSNSESYKYGLAIDSMRRFMVSGRAIDPTCASVTAMVLPWGIMVPDILPGINGYALNSENPMVPLCASSRISYSNTLTGLALLISAAKSAALSETVTGTVAHDIGPIMPTLVEEVTEPCSSGAFFTITLFRVAPPKSAWGKNKMPNTTMMMLIIIERLVNRMSIAYTMLRKSVGTARLELATSRPPGVRSIHLNYVPITASSMLFYHAGTVWI